MPDSHGQTGSDQERQEVVSGRYTMTEAARVKGVSYHTVSRAVRSGKLPAQRLGRMALIDAADLQAWQPMRERAPRKYRRAASSAAPGKQGPALPDQPAGEPKMHRLATAIATLHEGAADRTVTGFGDWLASLMASLLSLRQVVIWRCEGGLASLGAVGLLEHGDIPPSGEEVAASILRHLASRDHAQRLDALLRDQLPLARWFGPIGSRPVIAVPVRHGARVIGVAIGVSVAANRSFSEDEADIATQFGLQSAVALEHVELRQSSHRDLIVAPDLFDDLPLQVLAVDGSGLLVYVNDAVVRQWGDVVRKKQVGRHFSHFFGMFRREHLDGRIVGLDDHPMMRALHGEAVEDMSILVPDYYTEPRIFSVSSRPLHDTDGSISGAVLTSRDITAEPQSTRADDGSLALLAEARRKVDVLGALATEIAKRENVDNVFDIVARRVCEALGADSSVVLTPTADSHMVVRAVYQLESESLGLGRSVHRLQVPSSILAMAQRTLFFVGDDDAGPSGRVFLEEGDARGALVIPLIESDESLGVVNVMYADTAALRAVDQEFALALGRQCGHAIYLRNVVLELEASRRRMLTVLDQLPEAVVILDAPHGNVIAVNREAVALWGSDVERSGLRGAAITMLNQDGRPIRDEHQHPFLRPLRTGETELGVPLMTVDATGEHVDVLANLSPIVSVRGDLRGAVAVLQRREVFKPIDQAKDEFISVVAHELRNPLTSLRGNLQLLERRLEKIDDPAVLRELERVTGIIEQVDRVGALVSGMLDISRADLGKLTIDPAGCDAVELAAKARSDVEGVAEGRAITLEAPSSLPVVWDRMRIQQILTNVLSNAVRYAPEGDIHMVVAMDDADRVTISVRDHGPGVPPQLRRRLFRLYYRFDDGEETVDGLAARQRGLGIGLYISARLAAAHGGSIRVEDARGGGARFVLTLPRDTSTALPPD